MGVCNCSMLCCTLLCVRSRNAIILMGKRELVALLNLSFWCLVRLFIAVSQGCLRFVIVVFPDHTHLLFLSVTSYSWAYGTGRGNSSKFRTLLTNLMLLYFSDLCRYFINHLLESNRILTPGTIHG